MRQPRFRRAAAPGLALLASAAGLGWALAAEPVNEPAGPLSVPAVGKNAFSFPFATLDDDERRRFAIGNSFFRRNWVQAPSSTAARDGLGPHFIARSCGGCHDQDGRGAPPGFHRGLNEQPIGLLIRLSVGVPGQGRLATAPEPTYGDQFANRAITGVKPEGEVRIRLTPVRGHFADGTPYTLQAPHYELIHLAYGPLRKGTMLSPRIAPQLPGVGLLEAIADGDILGNARAQAERAGPIRGQVNQVRDAFSGEWRIGRFGWKANVPSLAHQTAAAFIGDMGITSSRFPDEACTPREADCLAAPGGATGKGTEIDDRTLGDVVFYESTLAPPARRGPGDARVRQGEALFHAAQCALCHRPGYITATPPFPELSSPRVAHQAIWPYTDLLLHDMGEALADHRPDGRAGGRQWKTPPLWGIGLIRDVNGHERLMHDGRADGVLEAVLWHGGEAEEARQQVLHMSAAERAALVLFVESL